MSPTYSSPNEGDFEGGEATGGKPGKARKSTSTRLVEAVGNAGWTLFLADGKPYATMVAGGRRETVAVESSAFRDWLQCLALSALGAVAGDGSVRDAANSLAALARHQGVTDNVHLRVARVGEAVYLDLCDRQGNVVEVTADGWKVTTDAAVHFVRHDNMAALPVPERGGKVDDLWHHLNVADDDRPLLRGFLLDFLKGKGPYLILLINGEQGSAKSTTTKMVRRILDPVAKASARHLNRDTLEISLACKMNAVLCYDNVSSLPQWASDVFASVATGSGFAVRKLYSHDEESVFGDARPIVFNGIPDFGEAPDLIDRAVKVTLPAIATTHRKTDERVWAEFEAALPKLLGSLLDLVAAGLRNHAAVTPDELPRMASSAVWVAACESGLPPDAERFAAAYARNRADLSMLALDNSPLATSLLRWLDGLTFDTWEGTSSALLGALLRGDNTYVETGSPRFPKDATRLSAELSRITPELRKVGVTVTRTRATRSRLVHIDARIRQADGRRQAATETVARHFQGEGAAGPFAVVR